MAFDLGFDVRASAGFVTDPPYAVPFLNESYPHTYTSANGDSLNGGITLGGSSGYNDSATNDPRIAGQLYRNNTGVPETIVLDLSSGSAPGAGTYTLDLAFGATYAAVQSFKVLDTATLLIDGTNGGAGYATAGGHYIDASLADVAATTTWTGTTVSKTFATTTANILFSVDSLTSYTTIDHFRLTLGGGGAPATTRLQHLAYGISNGIFLGR